MNFSSPFASPYSLFPSINSESSPAISDEQFKLFHSIDRKLYSLLVQTLGKLPLVSLNVLGLWLFLEHEVCTKAPSGLVNTILHSPLNLINKVFDESSFCLSDMHDTSLNVEKSNDEELFFLSRFLKKSVSKRIFVANKQYILSRVEYEVKHIYRALQDIQLRPEMFPPNYVVQNESLSSNLGNGTIVPTRTLSIDYPKNGTGIVVPTFSTGESSSSNVIPFPPQHYHSQVVGDLSQGNYGTYGYIGSKEKTDYPNNESASEHYFGMNMNSGEMVRETKVEEAVDRTIFLTFSKGYPLTESEVRDFFTRRFGDFIESIEMHGENPLFAKIVSKSVEMMDVVVDGGKAMYYINNKPVFARKFIFV